MRLDLHDLGPFRHGAEAGSITAGAVRANLALAAASTRVRAMDLDASALQRLLAGRAARIGKRPRLRVRLRSFDGVCRMVEAGVGVGIVPETTARSAARTLAVRFVPLADE